MNILVIDDEPLARRELRRLLAQLPGMIVVGEAAHADEAEAAIGRLVPDVILLDIEMPGASGFDLLERLESVPPVIFTTAYDHHAVRAFAVNALDYVVKPIELDRLAAALARVPPRSHSLERVFVREGLRCWLVPLREVRLIASDGNYVRLVWGEREILFGRSLTALEHRLDPRMFFRANRGEILNLELVASIKKSRAGGLVVELQGGPSVAVSRRQARLLAARLPEA